MATPVNDMQREFQALCALGGGLNGGPARGKVLDLLRSSGQRLNVWAYQVMAKHLNAYPDANPWHVCFAVSLSWGHLAQLDLAFTGHVVDLLADWNDDDLAAARSFFLERGPLPIEQSLAGAYMLFQKVALPAALPSTLESLDRAQQRWLGHVLTKDRPKYIGSWNATAMFMTALFAQPGLAATQRSQKPLLPPGGPVFAGLKMLYKAGLLSEAPAGSGLDDQAFEPGALYENNERLVELLVGRDDWCLTDVHSAVYLLGTRDPRSANWT